MGHATLSRLGGCSWSLFGTTAPELSVGPRWLGYQTDVLPAAGRLGRLRLGTAEPTPIRRPSHSLSVSRYLRLGWVPGPRTIVEGIFNSCPGTSLVGRTGEQRWSPGPAEPNPPRGTGAPEVAEAMGEAVAMHLVSDVPVGVFLSAGVDSAFVATLAARAGGRLRTSLSGSPVPRTRRTRPRPWLAAWASRMTPCPCPARK